MDLMEFIRKNVQETATNVYSEAEINLPTSRTERMAMLVHAILFHADVPERQAGVHARVTGQLCRSPQTTLLDPADPDCIWQWARHVNEDGVANEQCGWMQFQPPFLLAAEHVYLGVVQTNGLADLRWAGVTLGYTLSRITTEEFIAALVPY